MTTQDIVGLVERLRGAVTDWDGSQMVDGEPPRDVLRCRDLREAASALEHLAGENARLREAIKSYVDPITYEDILAHTALGDTSAGLDRQEKPKAELVETATRSGPDRYS